MYLTLRRWIAKYFRFESNSCVKNLPHFDTVYWFEAIFLMLLCKSKKVIRTKGIPFPESKLGSASAKENFHQLYSKHCFFSYSFSLKLSLVFICRENSRLSGILLFPDCPRFPECLGWTGSNLENRERFYFSDASQISAMAAIIPDKWKLRFVQSGTSAMDLALLPIPITNKHGVSRKHEWLLSRISCLRGKEEWYSVFSWLLPFQNRNSCIDERKNADVLRTTQHKLVCILVAV